MIYFSNEKIKFPRHSNEISTELVIINELTNEKTELDFVDESDDDKYYEIDLTNLELKNGTYKYIIGKEIGLLQVGDYQPTEVTEYNEKKTNVVYER